jgi:hypothetical protein
MVRKHLPNCIATAKGHLDRIPSGQPHANSEAVSARQRHHATATRAAIASLPTHMKVKALPFDPSKMPRSSTLDLDYIGPLPDVCSSGTR